jgi:ribosomal protein S18 acetylase RimI-like enzyme
MFISLTGCSLSSEGVYRNTPLPRDKIMVVVRKAVEKDIPRLLELYRQLEITTSDEEENKQPTPDDYRKVFSSINSYPGMELVVAEDKGKIIGSLEIMVVPNLSHKGLPWALVENVIVDEALRRTGVGRQLMQYAINRAKIAGCYRISLSSNNSRTIAHKFYESLGFKDSSIGFRLYL